MKKLFLIMLAFLIIAVMLLCAPGRPSYLYAQEQPSSHNDSSDDIQTPAPAQEKIQPEDESIDTNDTSGIDPWFLQNKDSQQQKQPQSEEGK